MNSQDLITLAEAARRLGMNVQTLRAWVAAGKLPAYRHGKRFTRVSWTAVLQSLELGVPSGSSASAEQEANHAS